MLLQMDINYQWTHLRTRRDKAHIYHNASTSLEMDGTLKSLMILHQVKSLKNLKNKYVFREVKDYIFNVLGQNIHTKFRILPLSVRQKSIIFCHDSKNPVKGSRQTTS